MSNSIFMTGGTGFLGRNLLTKFISENKFDKYYVLVRSPEKKEGLRRKFPNANIQYVLGDIKFPNLGLSTREIDELKYNVNQVWHVASSTSFYEQFKEEIRETNLDGLQNTINIIDPTSLDKLIYISDPEDFIKIAGSLVSTT